MYHKKNRLGTRIDVLERKAMLAAETLEAADTPDSADSAATPAPDSSAPDNPTDAGREFTSGTVTFPDAFIRQEDNGTVPASTVEATDSEGNVLTGDGVTIGIASNSINSLGGLDADIAAGELPSNVRVLGDGFPGDNDEGRAIAQLITDIAPNADLVFQTADNINDIAADDPRRGAVANGGNSFGDLQIARAIEILAEQDVDIIVDNQISTVAPIYQRGFEAQAQEAAVERGISVFQSAANSGSAAVEVPFNGEVGDFVDFDLNTPGVQGIPFNFSADELASAVLQWDDPYASVTPDGVQTADFDLFYLANESVIDNENPDNNVLVPGNLPITSSTRQQLDSENRGTGSDPYESVFVRNDANSAEGQWHARLVRGAGRNADGSDRLVRASFFDNASLNLGGSTLRSTSENTNNVGQVDVSTNSLLQASSKGPNTLIFDDNGDRLPVDEQVDVTVDFLGPTGINNPFLGFDSLNDPDAFPNFFGTSASAPAVAGVAALLLEVDPTLRPATLTDILADTADGRGDPDTTGSGLINAQAAVEETELRAQGESARREAAQVKREEAQVRRAERSSNNREQGDFIREIFDEIRIERRVGDSESRATRRQARDSSSDQG